MSVRFTDLLLELCEPINLQRYLHDKEEYLAKFDLSADERAALELRSNGTFRLHAKSVDDNDRRNSVNQFSRGPISMEVVVEVNVEVNIDHADLHVDVTIDQTVDSPPDLSAIKLLKVRFVDDDGHLYSTRSRTNATPEAVE
jgi:hypothetical protein